MIALPLEQLAGLGRLDVRDAASNVTGVQVDSRRISPGDLFVAVGDGTQFLDDARARGAAATLVPDDPFAALAAIAGAVRDRSTARVVGITGSTGKTSTKDILAALCAPRARTIAAEASFNNEIGVPLTLCRLEPDTEVCILELSMRGLGQIRDLCAFAKPEIGVITNIGPVHLELVETVERVAEAKAELIAALPAGGVAVVPEEPLLEPYLRDDVEIRRFGQVGEVGVFHVDGCDVRLRLNFTQRHQAQNTLAALHAYAALGFPLEDGELVVEFSRLRGEELPLPGGGVLINDCYNANPISMRAALADLAARGNGGRRVAVLGDMAELGPNGPGYHHEVGEAAAELGVDELVAIGELARGYVAGAAGVPARWAATVDEGIAEVRAALRPGDVVLVKGSRAMGLERIAEELL